MMKGEFLDVIFDCPCFGLLGMMTALPTTSEFITYDAVYLPKNHFIKQETLSTEDYLAYFFPFDKISFVKKGRESVWNTDNREMLAVIMAIQDKPQAVLMSFQKEYASRFTTIAIAASSDRQVQLIPHGDGLGENVFHDPDDQPHKSGGQGHKAQGIDPRTGRQADNAGDKAANTDDFQKPNIFAFKHLPPVQIPQEHIHAVQQEKPWHIAHIQAHLQKHRVSAVEHRQHAHEHPGKGPHCPVQHKDQGTEYPYQNPAEQNAPGIFSLFHKKPPVS